MVQKHFKELFPSILINMHHPDHYLSHVSKQALNLLLPESKYQQAVSKCRTQLIALITSILHEDGQFQRTPRLLAQILRVGRFIGEIDGWQGLEELIERGTNIVRTKNGKVEEEIAKADAVGLVISVAIFGNQTEQHQCLGLALTQLRQKDAAIQTELWRNGRLASLLQIHDNPAKLLSDICDCIQRGGDGAGAIMFPQVSEILEAFSKKNQLKQFTMEEICKRLLVGIAGDGGKFFGDEAIESFFRCVELGVRHSIKGIGRIISWVIKEFVEKSQKKRLSPYRIIPERIGVFLEKVEKNSESVTEMKSEFWKGLEKVHFSAIETAVLNAENFYELISAMNSKIKENSIFLQDFIVLINAIHEQLLKQFNQIEAMPQFNEQYQTIFFNLIEMYNQFFNSCVPLNANENELIYFGKEIIYSAMKNIEFLTNNLVKWIGQISKLELLAKFSQIFSQLCWNCIIIYYRIQNSIEENKQEQIKQIISKLLSIIRESLTTKTIIGFQDAMFISFFICFQQDQTLFNQYEIITDQQQKNILIEKSIQKIMNIQFVEKVLKENDEIQSLYQLFIEKFFFEQKVFYIQIVPVIAFILKNIFSDQKQINLLQQINNFLIKQIESTITIQRIDIQKILYIYTILTQFSEESLTTESQKLIKQSFMHFIKINEKYYQMKVMKSKELYKVLEKCKPMQLETVISHTFEVIQQILEDFFLLKQYNDSKEQMFGILCQEIRDFIQFLLLKKRNNEIKTFIQTKLIQPDLLKDALLYSEIFLLLKQVLQQSESILNYKEVFAFVPTNYWILTLLNCSKFSYGLSNHLEAKQFYLELAEMITESIVGTLEDTDENVQEFEKYVEFVFRVAVGESLMYSNALKKIFQKLFTNKLGKQKACEQIFKKFIGLFWFLKEQELDQWKNLEVQKLQRMEYILISNLSLIKDMALLDQFNGIIDPLVEFCNNQVDNILKNEIATTEQQFLIYLNILCSLNINRFEDDSFIQECIYYIFKYFGTTEKIHSYELNQNFVLSIMFQFINLVVEKKTFIVFSENILQIQSLFKYGFTLNKKRNKFASNALIMMNAFIRKILVFIEGFSDDFRNYIFENIFSLCLIKVEEMFVVPETIEKDLLIDESNDFLILEFAETIQRLATVIDCPLDENMMFALLNCGSPSIQKSAYFLLMYYYKQKSKPINPAIILPSDSDELANYLWDNMDDDQLFPQYLLSSITTQSQEIDDDDEEDYENEQISELLLPKHFGYILSWICLIQKLSSPLQSAQSQTLNQMYFQLFEKNKSIWIDYLSTLVDWITHLNLSIQEQKELLKNINISHLSPEWQDFLSESELFKLCVLGIYNFVSNFPMYLRQWLDECNKKYIKVMENIIKMFISQSLFLNEVENIELKQAEWKSEEFSVYIIENTREIQAIYTKEGQSLEIIVKVPQDYPIRQIEIEHQKSVKISEMKIKKWILMMRSLMMNQNNSIINAFILWKTNIDKELEGIEECPICYYVIHSTTKELPRLACKTCKKKFHSSCINRWFQTSNKSECPLCKSQFL